MANNLWTIHFMRICIANLLLFISLYMLSVIFPKSIIGEYTPTRIAPSSTLYVLSMLSFCTQYRPPRARPLSSTGSITIIQKEIYNLFFSFIINPFSSQYYNIQGYLQHYKCINFIKYKLKQL